MNAFTTARGYTQMVGPYANKIVIGRLSSSAPNRIAIPSPDDPNSELTLPVDPYTISFSTGFTDRYGNDIFTGDFLSLPSLGSQDKALVVFDEDNGAFYATAPIYLDDITQEGDGGDIIYGNYTGTKFSRLTQDVAGASHIVGNFYSLIFDIETNYDPTSDITNNPSNDDSDGNIEDMSDGEPGSDGEQS